MNAAPLRLSTERVVMYGALLTLICLAQIRFVVAQGFGDWRSFWAAGSTAGTPSLLDPHSHAIWQTAHHVPTTIFPYQPGAAWFWYPFKFMSLPAGYAINVILMAAAAIASAAIAARIYQIPTTFAVPLTLAWAPVTAALATGQNSPVGLLLSLCAILALVADSQVMSGLAVGALLYKLPYALPLIIVLLVRRKTSALAIVAACAAAWYILGAAASGGDWHWPSHYAAALQGYFAADAHHNATKAISIPSLLLRAGVPQMPALLAGAALFALSIPLLMRVSLLEAASFALLVSSGGGPARAAVRSRACAARAFLFHDACSRARSNPSGLFALPDRAVLAAQRRAAF